MKSTILTLPLFLLLIISSFTSGCGNESTNIGVRPTDVVFSTDRALYAVVDTIKLSLDNTSSSDVCVGLRCGSLLEMFYQKKDSSRWGDTVWFPYMSLGCLTVSDTVRVNTVFAQSLPAVIFNSSGTFRLTVNVFELPAATSRGVVSNTFEIQ